MSTPKIILGIDPGLARLGWGVVELHKSQLALKNFGVIETKPSQTSVERLFILHRELSEIIERLKPETVAVEKLFFGKNAKTAMRVGEARGVILLTIAISNLPLIEYTPAEIKIALTGYGNADKQQIQQMVMRSLKLKTVPKPDDAADALAVAITAAVSKNFN